MPKTYEIGDAVVLLDEIAAIEKVVQYISNGVFVPIVLKNGARIKAWINAKNGELAANQSDPHTMAFLNRFTKEYQEFKTAWQGYVLNEIRKGIKSDPVIIASEFFDPLICRIMHIRQADMYIEFTIPPNLSIDNDQVLLYFNEDAVISFERGKAGVLRGTIKDKKVFDYLIKKLKQL